MPTPSEPASASASPPLPSTPWAVACRGRVLGGGWLRTLALVCIALLLALSAGLLLVQRQATLDLAQAQALREVQRLAAELQQSLQLARASMAAASQSPGHAPQVAQDLQRPLVDALSLPFAWRMLTPDAAQAASADRWPVAQWLPERVQAAGDHWVLPLRWRQPPADGGQAYQVTLPRAALLARFASEGLPAGGSMSLFRLEDDGATTVLVRHPVVEKEQGMTLRGHVADAVRRAPSGVFQVTSMIDGVPRIVGYQRLSLGAERLVVVYALSMQSVLAGWLALLPAAVLLTLLVGAAMAYGAWRLDRSMHALSRSERHFQTLTDHMPDVVVRYDQAARVLYVNPAVEAASGIRPEAMLGRSFEAFGTPPAAAALWRACLQRVFATGQAETLYFVYPGPQGERHWEAQASLEPAVDGEAPTVLVINRDITERVQAENRRRTAQQLFESVFQAAPEAMSLGEWDSGRLLLVNDAFCALFGRAREQLVGHSAVALGLWQGPELRQQIVDRLQRGEQVRDAVASSTRPDGRSIHVRFSAERVQVDGQDRLLLMFRDVTQLEGEQRALARSELRFRLAAEQGQVWEWNLAHGGPPPSEAFRAALGYPAQTDDRGVAALTDLIHPDDLPGWQLALRRYLKGQAPYRVELRARDVQGHYRWFELRGSGQRDATGRVTYMAGTAFDISDRKALEEEWRQTLSRLDAVANASPALFWTTDTHQQPDWVNDAWLNFTGRDLVTEIETFWLEDLHPQDQERCAHIFNRACEAREAYSMEYRMRRHDGIYRWLLEQGQPRYDADGRFIGFIGSCLDVTELKQAQATASESGAMLQQVFDVLKDMLFVVDAQDRFVFFQAGAGDRLYRRPEDFLGRPFAEVLPPTLVADMRVAMAMARNVSPQEINYSLDLSDGVHHFNARLAWLPGGEQCMFLVRDTTEQEAAHRARERLNDFVLLLFRLASRFINLPVQQMDAAIDSALRDMGTFVDADRAYLFAYDLPAGTASDTHEWCAPGIAPQRERLQNLQVQPLAHWHQMHLRGEQVAVSDVQALPPGALRTLLEALELRGLLTLPLMHGGTCLGFVGLDAVRQTRVYGREEVTLLELFAQMLVNMRLRAQAAAQVSEMTDRLEQNVQERTQQLNDSVQRLQTVNRELESFTYSASHDLRTPLRGIEGFSALLLHEHASQLDDQGREYLQRIQRATLHMSQLVNDLLAYSRLQQLTEHSVPVALAASVREVVAPFRDELEARQGQLDVQVPEDLRVQANPKGVAIVLRNLIDNALKFTPANAAPRIFVEALVQGDRVLLSVSDQGIGFDMKYHDRIFGMFQRLHRQDQIPGTGIGLALVHKAVERMGGQIRAQSEPGRGARFEVELPLA